MKIKITRKSKSDIPNYRDAGKATTRNCGTCSSFSAGNCSKYSAGVQSSYVCNAWIPNIEKVKSEATVIREKESKGYGCLYFSVSPYEALAALSIATSINPADLAGEGIEENPHVTLLYGLRDDSEALAAFALERVAPLKIEFGSLSLFENPDFDVLKIDVSGSKLDDTFETVEDYLPNANEHKIYQPHLTIAYLKPGMGKKYLTAANPLQGYKSTFEKVVYSSSNEEVLSVYSLRDSRDYGFKVYKEASGELRWLSISSTSFKDRDRQYMSKKGLEQAVAWNDQRKEYGPLRFWHLDGVDIGDCDFSMMYGKVLLESGTFRKKEWGEAVANNPDIGGVSIGFKHPENEPKSGVFENFLITERSIMPRGKESNLFTGFTIKENDMSASNLVKISSLVSTFGEDEALKILESAKAVERDAEDKGHTFKESFDYQTATPDEIIAYGELKKKEAEEAAAAEELAAEIEIEEEISLDADGLKELIVAAVKEVVAAMIPAEKEAVETKKETGPDLLAQIETLKQELKELKGDAPRANGSYRASTDSDMKTTTKAADETPISDVDRMAKSFAHPYYGEAK